LLLADVKRAIKNLLKEHPALLVSAMYVAASVVGMFYAWAYLRHFGINVFNYSQISDFLLASLKEPATWVLVILAIILVLIDNASSRKVASGKPAKWIAWYGSPRYRFINNFVAVFIVFMFIYIFATFQARDTRNGDGKFVDVMFTDSGAAVSALLLGTTGQFVFLYDDRTGRVDIHPIENIHSISFMAPNED
jgi:uncharacterized membrane protein